MLEQQFENDKQFLLSKLPDYLKLKNINIDSNFKCLNPKDTSFLPSMRYVPETYTVKCFNCNAQYNIYDLIGIDYSLPTFEKQFAKAYETFIGKLPIGYVQLLRNQALNNSQMNSGSPVFEIADDYKRNTNISPFDKQAIMNSSPYSAALAQEKAESSKHANFIDRSANEYNEDQVDQNRGFLASPFDEPKIRQFSTATTPNTLRSSTNTFGNGFNQPTLGKAPSEQSISQNMMQRKFPSYEESQGGPSRFVDTFQSPFQQTFKNETNFDFSDYINACTANVGKTNYFTKRGITEAVIKKFKLGFDENFHAEIDKITGLPSNWKAAIIPYGTHGYCVRNTNLDANVKTERYKKKGHFDIYNSEILNEPGDIFITEGEFDALSIESLGHKAIALGGASNTRALFERIKLSTEKHKFYICLDADEAGIEATKQIASFLYQMDLEYSCVNLAHPYKDINDALCQNPLMLKERIENLDKILSYKFKSIEKPSADLRYVDTPEDLNTLSLSPTLYSFCANPLVLRRFVSSVLKSHLLNAIYAGNNGQWNLLQNLLTSGSTNQNFDVNEWSNIKFLEINTQDIQKQLIDGIDSQTLQGNINFVAFIDLTAFTQEKSLEIMQSISNNSNQIGVPIIALCNTTVSGLADSLVVQNVNIKLSDNGDFICETINKKGIPVSFVKCNGI